MLAPFRSASPSHNLVTPRPARTQLRLRKRRRSARSRLPRWSLCLCLRSQRSVVQAISPVWNGIVRTRSVPRKLCAVAACGSSGGWRAASPPMRFRLPYLEANALRVRPDAVDADSRNVVRGPRRATPRAINAAATRSMYERPARVSVAPRRTTMTVARRKQSHPSRSCDSIHRRR